jgi:hypothetical protein
MRSTTARSSDRVLRPLPMISPLGTALRTSPQPPLSRSDLVPWHYPDPIGRAEMVRSARVLPTSIVPLSPKHRLLFRYRQSIVDLGAHLNLSRGPPKRPKTQAVVKARRRVGPLLRWREGGSLGLPCRTRQIDPRPAHARVTVLPSPCWRRSRMHMASRP